jgi:hypothetical protein
MDRGQPFDILVGHAGWRALALISLNSFARAHPTGLLGPGKPYDRADFRRCRRGHNRNGSEQDGGTRVGPSPSLAIIRSVVTGPCGPKCFSRQASPCVSVKRLEALRNPNECGEMRGANRERERR